MWGVQPMRILILPVLIISFLMTGCAGTAPKAKFVDNQRPEVYIDADDSAVVSVVGAAGVEVHDYERERIAQLISHRIEEKKASNAADGQAKDYLVSVELTRYEKGNAFARAMLAGLGRIHIDANVDVSDAKTNDTLSKFEIDKTFAWGGMYGGTTRIEDIEPAFAEGVAATLTGISSENSAAQAKN